MSFRSSDVVDFNTAIFDILSNDKLIFPGEKGSGAKIYTSINSNNVNFSSNYGNIIFKNSVLGTKTFVSKKIGVSISREFLYNIDNESIKKTIVDNICLSINRYCIDDLISNNENKINILKHEDSFVEIIDKISYHYFDNIVFNNVFNKILSENIFLNNGMYDVNIKKSTLKLGNSKCIKSDILDDNEVILLKKPKVTINSIKKIDNFYTDSYSLIVECIFCYDEIVKYRIGNVEFEEIYKNDCNLSEFIEDNFNLKIKMNDNSLVKESDDIINSFSNIDFEIKEINNENDFKNIKDSDDIINNLKLIIKRV